MELPLTLQETSMWQGAPMEDLMVIPVQESMTSSLLSTTQVELSSGRISLGHQVVIMIRELHPTHPETFMWQETHLYPLLRVFLILKYE